MHRLATSLLLKELVNYYDSHSTLLCHVLLDRLLYVILSICYIQLKNLSWRIFMHYWDHLDLSHMVDAYSASCSICLWWENGYTLQQCLSYVKV